MLWRVSQAGHQVPMQFVPSLRTIRRVTSGVGGEAAASRPARCGGGGVDGRSRSMLQKVRWGGIRENTAVWFRALSLIAPCK